MKGLDLQKIGYNIAPQLGLNVEGNGKISAADGQSLTDKVGEAIASIKSENKLKTNAVSKAVTPGGLSRRSRERRVKGFFLLKRTGGPLSPTKKHKLIGKRAKHLKKAVTGSRRQMPKQKNQKNRRNRRRLKKERKKKKKRKKKKEKSSY